MKSQPTKNTSLAEMIETIQQNGGLEIRTDQNQRDTEYISRIQLIELLIWTVGDFYSREHILQIKHPTHESHQIFSNFWSPIVENNACIQQYYLEYKEIWQLLYGSSKN